MTTKYQWQEVRSTDRIKLYEFDIPNVAKWQVAWEDNDIKHWWCAKGILAGKYSEYSEIETLEQAFKEAEQDIDYTIERVVTGYQQLAKLGLVENELTRNPRSSQQLTRKSARAYL